MPNDLFFQVRYIYNMFILKLNSDCFKFQMLPGVLSDKILLYLVNLVNFVNLEPNRYKKGLAFFDDSCYYKNKFPAIS